MKKSEERRLNERIEALETDLRIVETNARIWPRYSPLRTLADNIWAMARGLNDMELLKARDAASHARVQLLEIELQRARAEPKKKQTYRSPRRKDA